MKDIALPGELRGMFCEFCDENIWEILRMPNNVDRFSVYILV